MTAFPHILPIGTHIVLLSDAVSATSDGVLPAGSVAVIVRQPVDVTHAYRVQFADGSEVTLQREQMAVRRQHRNPSAPDEYLEDVDMYQYVIYRCVIGSRAYGLDHDDSDTDLRGIYLPPADLHWSLHGVPEQLERGEEAYWEIEKFVTLALKANPNILECLYSPMIELAEPIAQELLAMRSLFLSKLVYQTFNGYLMSQFRKIDRDIENHGSIRWKHAMHLIRLLLSGIATISQGVVPVRVDDEHHERLMAIRSGSVPWADVNIWRLQLHQQFDKAYASTSLPELPDYGAADDFLIRARRSMI